MPQFTDIKDPDFSAGLHNRKRSLRLGARMCNLHFKTCPYVAGASLAAAAQASGHCGDDWFVSAHRVAQIQPKLAGADR
jgi:hypothetical protein